MSSSQTYTKPACPRYTGLLSHYHTFTLSLTISHDYYYNHPDLYKASLSQVATSTLSHYLTHSLPSLYPPPHTNSLPPPSLTQPPSLLTPPTSSLQTFHFNSLISSLTSPWSRGFMSRGDTEQVRRSRSMNRSRSKSKSKSRSRSRSRSMSRSRSRSIPHLYALPTLSPGCCHLHLQLLCLQNQLGVHLIMINIVILMIQIGKMNVIIKRMSYIFYIIMLTILISRNSSSVVRNLSLVWSLMMTPGVQLLPCFFFLLCQRSGVSLISPYSLGRLYETGACYLAHLLL